MRRSLLLALTLVLATLAAVFPTGSAGARTAPATLRIVHRLVTTAGHLASGTTWHGEDGAIDCTYQSDVAVDKGIRFCGTSADYTPACYRGYARPYALCVRNPFGHEVVRIRATFHALQPSGGHAVPFGLILDNGTHCSIRDGGAWSSPQEHPSWVGYYFCGRSLAVFASVHRADTSGINMTNPSWTVPVGRADGSGRLVTHHILRAYYVGYSH